MLQQERKNQILEIINKDRILKASDLVERFGVSMETIRRDLEELEQAGNLRRVYGGAVLGTIYGSEPSYNNRLVTHLPEKQAIARAVADLVENGDTLFMDGGTTLVEIARCLCRSNKRNLTVITNAMPVAGEMIRSEECNVIMLGGALTRGEPLSTGFLCNEGLGYFHADKTIIGVAGITAKNGVSDYSVEISSTKREMIRRSEKLICVADFSKFGVNATAHVCDLGQVSALVTDWTTPEEALAESRAAGVNIIVAQPAGRPAEG